MTSGKNSLWLCGQGTLVQWLPVWGLRLLGFPTGAPELHVMLDALPGSRIWDAAARSVHVPLIGEVLRTMERRLPLSHQGCPAPLFHHFACE